MLQANEQQRGTGAIFNTLIIEANPQKVTLSFRGFASMPSSYTLAKYCSTPAKKGTCGAFNGRN